MYYVFKIKDARVCVLKRIMR